MRVLLPASALIFVASLPAAAEDFTGFYAGVNAGYAFSRDRAGRSAASLPSNNAASPDSEPGLPPSAASAARSMQGERERPSGSPRR